MQLLTECVIPDDRPGDLLCGYVAMNRGHLLPVYIQPQTPRAQAETLTKAIYDDHLVPLRYVDPHTQAACFLLTPARGTQYSWKGLIRSFPDYHITVLRRDINTLLFSHFPRCLGNYKFLAMLSEDEWTADMGELYRSFSIHTVATSLYISRQNRTKPTTPNDPSCSTNLNSSTMIAEPSPSSTTLRGGQSPSTLVNNDVPEIYESPNSQGTFVNDQVVEGESGSERRHYVLPSRRHSI
ncbi:hypothetical protein F5Y12DRAFT_735307 [Xylaria sp. FL1777]|nr:hypothetical protein F5Y12DRAFT_735307 [Xylaria sp. FL1777]